METIIKEIESALAAGVYYLALICTLSLPDVCAALESPAGTTSGRQYKAWYSAWLTSHPEITGDDLYSLRCGVLHQGQLGHPDCQYARILFTIPNAAGNVFHRNIIDDALNLDVVTFCRNMIDAVSRWYAANQNDPNVQRNLPRLVQYHAQGLAPYMVGMPLIA